MKLKDLLKEAYEQQPLDYKIEQAIKYAYKYLYYIGESNKILHTLDEPSFGNEREPILFGEDEIEKGIYLLYTDAHKGSEILVEQSSYESALVKQKEYNNIGFNPYDYCSLIVVE